MAGLSAQQIRNYEALGFLPQAPRSATGYRQYGAVHVEALAVARTVIRGYGWGQALEVMRAAHRRDLEAALTIADACHADLHRRWVQVEETLAALDVVAGQMAAGRLGSPQGLKSGEAAAKVGVRVSALRFWEREGLLSPARDRFNGYRVFDQLQLRRLQVVALLRQAGYRFDVIRAVLDELASGRPDRAQAALSRRREELVKASWACAEATGALRDYVRATWPALGG